MTTSRTYKETHPWITFQIDLNEVTYRFWLLLGEAASKIEHVTGSLLRPSIAAELHQVFVTKGILATTAIEGSTLTEDQVRQRIAGHLTLPATQEDMGLAIDNIVEACNLVANQLRRDSHPALDSETIVEYNRLILQGLELEDGVVPGEIRQHQVGVHSYSAPPATDCEYLLKRLCDWLNGDAFQAPDDELELPFAIIKAVVAHLYLAWIHPFGDGNGRTARLVELRILLAAGVPTPAAHLLSNHYNLTRPEYYQELADASGSRKIGAFLEYGITGLVEGLRQQLNHIRAQQLKDRWEQYVYQEFGKALGSADPRRRQLVLDLSKLEGPVVRSDLRHLSPELAEMYSSKTDRMLTRDLNALLKMELIEKTPEGYLPRRGKIKAFWPVVS